MLSFFAGPVGRLWIGCTILLAFQAIFLLVPMGEVKIDGQAHHVVFVRSFFTSFRYGYRPYQPRNTALTLSFTMFSVGGLSTFESTHSAWEGGKV